MSCGKTQVPWLCSGSQPGLKGQLRAFNGTVHTETLLVKSYIIQTFSSGSVNLSNILFYTILTHAFDLEVKVTDRHFHLCFYASA